MPRPDVFTPVHLCPGEGERRPGLQLPLLWSAEDLPQLRAGHRSILQGRPGLPHGAVAGREVDRHVRLQVRHRARAARQQRQVQQQQQSAEEAAQAPPRVRELQSCRRFVQPLRPVRGPAPQDFLRRAADVRRSWSLAPLG